METRWGFTGEDGAAGVRAGTGAAQALLQGWRRGAAEPRRLLTHKRPLGCWGNRKPFTKEKGNEMVYRGKRRPRGHHKAWKK